MKIKLKTSFVSEVATFNVGDVVEWDDDNAASLVEADLAESAEIEIKEPAKSKRGKADVASSDGNDSGN